MINMDLVMLKRLILAATLLVCFVGVGNSQVTIVGYDSTNPNTENGAPSPDLPAAESAEDVVASLYARGPGLVANTGITLNSSSWRTAGNLDLGSDDYLSWGWTEGTGRYDLTNLTLQYDRSGSGPSRIGIYVSINGGALDFVFADTNVDVSDETASIDLTEFDNVSSAEFRLFGYNASDIGGTFDLEEFTPEGAPQSRAIVVSGVSVVPEPGSLTVLVVGGISLLARRRRF